MNEKVPIEISARHIHLSQKDLEALFGKEYQLKKIRKLSQADDFAAKETLDIKIGSKIIKKLRIIGPVRKETQIELSITDAVGLGINLPLRFSGNIRVTPGSILIGPQKKIKIKEGVIIARRHLHCNPKEAKKLKLKDGMSVPIEIKGARGLIFHNIRIRIGKNYKLAVHLDTDEGNAAGIIKKGEGKIILKT
jgi:propanediol utilization protein